MVTKEISQQLMLVLLYATPNTYFFGEEVVFDEWFCW